MARAWRRAARWMLCGRCGHALAVGSPVQVITLTGVQRELHRCAGCADGEVPPDLPARVLPGSRTRAMTPIRTLKTWQDWKAKASGA
jgi:hypothetical protein